MVSQYFKFVTAGYYRIISFQYVFYHQNFISMHLQIYEKFFI